MEPLAPTVLCPATPCPWAVRDGFAVYRFGRGEPVLFMPGPHRFQKPGDGTADALRRFLRASGQKPAAGPGPGPLT